MLKIKIKNAGPKVIISTILVWGYTVVCWFVNVYKLVACDWAMPAKDEIVHAIGLFPPCAWITAWM